VNAETSTYMSRKTLGLQHNLKHVVYTAICMHGPPERMHARTLRMHSDANVVSLLHQYLWL